MKEKNKIKQNKDYIHPDSPFIIFPKKEENMKEISYICDHTILSFSIYIFKVLIAFSPFKQ